MRFTTKGRITLLRDGVQISQHVLAEEAYERAYAHALANGPGKYTVRYPDREVDLSTLTRVVLEAAPAGLITQAISSTQVNVTWTANPRAASYRVYRNSVLVGSPTTASYSDTGLSPSTAYTYTVSVVSATTGEGPQTAGVQGTTLAAPDTTAPTAPVITATPTGQSTISVALTTPATDSQSGVASYDLEYKTAAASTYTAITPVTAAQFPYIIGSLSPATTYNTRARARDGVGNIGAYSAISNATTQAASGGGDPYPLYTSFDRNDIPWHTASGVWGAQVPLQAVTPPNITAGQFTANSAAEVASLSATPGRRIIIGQNMGNVTVGGNGFTRSDIEIVLPPGIRIGEFVFEGNISRCAIVGPSAGYSGGSMSKFRSGFGAVVQSDLLIRGIGISGTQQHIIEPHFGIDRMAIIDCRIRAGAAIAYMQDIRHLFVANTSGIAGVNGGNNSTWGFRHDGQGPIVFVDCDLRTPFAPGVSAFHRIRSSPPIGDTTGIKHFYVDDSVFVDSGQATFIMANQIGSNGAGDVHASMIVRRVRTYSSGAGGNGTIFPFSVRNYAEVTGGQYFGRPSTADLASSESGSLATNRNFSNNQFLAYAGDPAWTAAGDPTALPLT